MKNFQQPLFPIDQVHNHLMTWGVNLELNIRNWLVDFYIVEFEQYGQYREEYREKVIASLGEKLFGIIGIDQRSLFRFRNLYLLYPHFIHCMIEIIRVKLLRSNMLRILWILSPHLSNELRAPSERILSKKHRTQNA